MLFCACYSMWGIARNNETNQEETTFEVANFICEEAVIKDKEKFGRVRSSLMEYLRAKYGYDIADRALSRINKRKQEHYFNS
jgi:hypothetical protein